MFRFSIRDILWLTVLAAVTVMWWIDRTKLRIDWLQVKADQQALEVAKREAVWAKKATEMAREQKASILKAAAQRGITQLDIEPETVIPKPMLDE
jgi:hypothetical protein